MHLVGKILATPRSHTANKQPWAVMLGILGNCPAKCLGRNVWGGEGICPEQKISGGILWKGKVHRNVLRKCSGAGKHPQGCAVPCYTVSQLESLFLIMLNHYTSYKNTSSHTFPISPDFYLTTFEFFDFSGFSRWMPLDGHPVNKILCVEKAFHPHQTNATSVKIT